jgi:predicted nucleic acid-binding protein
MSTRLLDGNALVALCLDGHEHHRLVRAWLASHDDRIATCSVTQGTLLRLHMRFAEDRSAAAAWTTLQQLCASPRHVLWLADYSYLDLHYRNLQGPKQVTDAWLAELARRRGGMLSTLDGALVSAQCDVAELIAPM